MPRQKKCKSSRKHRIAHLAVYLDRAIIAERSGVIKEKIKAVREDEQPERKEKTDHVQFR